MSLLDTQTTELSVAARGAQRLKGLPAFQFSLLLNSWKAGVEIIWAKPALTVEVLAALGTDAAELFDLSSKTAAFLHSVKPGCVDATVALINQYYTVHQDGTVTLDTPPE